MPRVDMPLEQLLKYAGMNPKPDDMNEYWDRALQEMRQQPAEVELVPSSFQVPFADCFHLYFTGVGGARIHAKYIRPKSPVVQSEQDQHPAIILFHGYTSNSGDWSDKLGYAALGFSVFAMDCRGQGGRSEDAGGVKGTTYQGHIIRGLDDHPDRLLFRQIFLDAAQLAGIVMERPEVDPNRVGVTGGSQGGGLSLACAALEPRIRKVAAIYPFLTDYYRVWEMDMANRAYEELKTYFRKFDPRHEREREVFTRLGYIDVQHLADRIQAEVYMGVGLMDLTCPPSTQFALYNKISSPKRLEIYPDYAHENLPEMNDFILTFMEGFLEEAR
ncbi:alpha/beta fold hydrolase [Paenibacillus koleovorans]|uniref:alpha/beta fold hydrolase n=1 Tax=Paenibacillus koleovorans TaxID=121608 RepID=UPI000FD9F986|nr:alpha/beta fold hydrolase [Paenibacillus koleovorans]